MWRVMEEDSIFAYMCVGIYTHMCTPTQVQMPYMHTNMGGGERRETLEVISNSPEYVQLESQKERGE